MELIETTQQTHETLAGWRVEEREARDLRRLVTLFQEQIIGNEILIAKRDRELAAQQKTLSNQQTKSKDEIEKHRKAHKRAVAERDQLRKYVLWLEKEHDAVLNATTWRISEPLRWVLRQLRQQAPKPPFTPRYR